MKFDADRSPTAYVTSHPARGAWIEILSEKGLKVNAKVAPRKGCVE